jgi:hypothetical protein
VPRWPEVDADSDHDVPPVVLVEYCSPLLLLPDLWRRLNKTPNVVCRLSDVCLPADSLVEELFPLVVLSEVEYDLLDPWEYVNWLATRRW